MTRLWIAVALMASLACGGTSSNTNTSTNTDPRDAIINGNTEATTNTYWLCNMGIPYRFELLSNGTVIESMGAVGNGSRAYFTWQKVDPGMILTNATTVSSRIYIQSFTNIRGSLQNGSFSTDVFFTDGSGNGCNAALVPGPMP